MRRRIYIAAILLALPYASMSAQGTAFPFTRIDRSPVTSALAGAGSASTLGAAYAAFSNPAMLPFLEGDDAFDSCVSLQFWAPGTAKSTNTDIGVSYKINPRFSVTGGVAFQVAAGYDTYDSSGAVNGTYSPKDYILALGAAFGITESLSAGANFHLAGSAIASDASYTGVNFDIFVGYRPIESLKLTAGISSLGGGITGYDKKKYPLPTSVKVAGDYTLAFSDAVKLDLVADADYYFSKDFSVAAGADFRWKFLRAGVGYRYASKTAPVPSHLGVGLGFNLGGFTLNVSYLTASAAIANTITAGLGYSF